jgi:hypothetical protein
VIDIKTFMLVLGIGNLCFAGLIAGYARSGTVNPTIRMWQWAKLVQGCAHLLSWLRPDWPMLWLAMLANSALVVGIACEAAAYGIHFKLPHWKRYLLPGVIVALMALHGARLAGSSPSVLTAIMSLIIGTLIGTMAIALLLTNGYKSPLQRIIGVNNIVFCAAMLGRAVSATRDAAMSAFTPGLAQSFTYLIGYIVLMVNGFGFLLLCKEEDTASWSGSPRSTA